MVGRAYTVSINGDFLGVMRAIQAASPGDVLMIDANLRGDDVWPVTGGMFGELLATEAQNNGLAGLVIDGNCRDTRILRTLHIPIYSRGCHPNAGTAIQLGETQLDVSMGGLTVQAGDYVLGDDDGVVVATAEELQAWLPAAEAIQAAEDEILSAITGSDGVAPQSLLNTMTNFNDHVEARRGGKTSSLAFMTGQTFD